MGKLVKFDGGGKFVVEKTATVSELKKSGEIGRDDVVFDASDMKEVKARQELTPGKFYGIVPPNDLG